MVTEGKWKKFCEKLDKQKSIYDLLVLLYLQVKGEDKPKYIKEYYEMLEHAEKGYWGCLPQITNEWLMECISFEYYRKHLAGCIRRENLRHVAIRLLFEFDRYFLHRTEYPALALRRERLAKEVYGLGPLNQGNSQYGFYLMPEAHYFKDYNKKSGLGIRFLEQSAFHGIDARVKSYKIVRKKEMGKSVNIKYCPGITGFEKNDSIIKIGIIPVFRENWFQFDLREYSEKNYFYIEDKKKWMKSINDAYLKALQKCIDEKIQIVVFPELARNKDTERIVRDFLIQSSLMGTSPLELVFLGSLWKDGKNEGVLLSGAGAVLMRSPKVNPFSLKLNGKEYWEELTQESQKISLIDIPQLGRMQYLVCKDGLNDALQRYLGGVFGVAFSVISSFSDSISHFENLGRHFGTEYGGIQVLANACAARKQEEGEVGHIIVPCGKELKAPSSCKKAYRAEKHCKEVCHFGACIHVFQIDPSQMVEGNSVSIDYVEEECILLFTAENMMQE